MKTTRRRVLQGAAILAGAGVVGKDAKAAAAASPAQSLGPMYQHGGVAPGAINGSGPIGRLPGAPDLATTPLNSIAGVQADSGPYRTESGVGALMAWADKLWAVTYLSNPLPHAGSGTGLYVIDEKLNIQKLHASNGCYANRLLHWPSNQIFIGPYVIDMQGNFRVIRQLLGQRLTATINHLRDPGRLYMLTMEGQFYELDVDTLRATKLYDLVKEWGIRKQPHFKGGFSNQGRVVVANNTYPEPGDTNGKLAEWDGKAWKVLENKPFMEVASRYNAGFGNVIFATGWDESSAILKALFAGKWKTYRLPKASHCFDQYWQTEWTRIREVETERYLMDCHGMFYELATLGFYNSIWGVRPISTHLRVVPDFCSYRGMLALGGNEATPTTGNPLSPQAQSGIWFGKADDLWRFGKPAGWGGPWRETPVKAGEASDPYLMFGFDQKVLHLVQTGASRAEFTVEVDILGNGAWQRYDRIQVATESMAITSSRRALRPTGSDWCLPLRARPRRSLCIRKISEESFPVLRMQHKQRNACSTRAARLLVFPPAILQSAALRPVQDKFVH